MLRIDIKHNFPEVARTLQEAGKQARFAAALALNRTTERAGKEVQQDMQRVFDRPTPYFLRSLRVIRANVRNDPVESALWFKDKSVVDNASSMVLPHVEGGSRQMKPFEGRLRRMGALPVGWYAVPGAAATLDAYGNMSRGQISTLLNVLGAYSEAGYNKANAATVARFKKGTRTKYGFEYWINRVGGKAKHLPPGVYKRVKTPFGSSLKPVLIFVHRTQYRRRLDFYGQVQRTFAQHFPREFDQAFQQALRTAR